MAEPLKDPTQLFLDFVLGKPSFYEKHFLGYTHPSPNPALRNPEVFAQVDFAHVLAAIEERSLSRQELYAAIRQGNKPEFFSGKCFVYTPVQFETLLADHLGNSTWSERDTIESRLDKDHPERISRTLRKISVHHAIFGTTDLNPYNVASSTAFHPPGYHTISFPKGATISEALQSLDIVLSELTYPHIKELIAGKFRFKHQLGNFTSSDYQELDNFILKHGITTPPNKVFEFSLKSIKRKSPTQEDLIREIGAIINNDTIDETALDLRGFDLTRIDWRDTMEAVAVQYGLNGLEVLSGVDITGARIRKEDHWVLASARTPEQQTEPDEVIYSFRAGAGYLEVAKAVIFTTELTNFSDRVRQIAQAHTAYITP
ncbi:MAG: hypothetical protein J0L97_08070 [Alphaproteobacteria bacterium]|nr:hypothetical protein [Alphaproteobacteria bacterium]